MNEIKQQLKMKIGDTTLHQRNVLGKIQQRYPTQSKKRKSYIPAILSITVLAATLFFVFLVVNDEKTLNHTTSSIPPNSVIMTNSVTGEVIELEHFEYSSFLNYVINGNYGKKEDVLSTLKYIPIQNKHNPAYFITFDCGKEACASAYLVLDNQTLTSTTSPLGEGILSSNFISSPNEENVMFLLSNNEKTKQRIVIINFEFNGESRIPTVNHEYFSSYNWPITDVHWITNNRIEVTFADIEEATEENVKKWVLDLKKSTKTIELPLANRNGV